MARIEPRRPIWLLSAALAATWAGACAHTRSPSPPEAKVMPHETEIHGEVRIDEYHWLRERGTPQVIAHLEAENRHTAGKMKHTEALQASLFEEMKGRIQETDSTVPVKHGGYYYYSRTVEGLQYPIHCRKKGSLETEEEILIDENELAEGHEYFQLAAYDPSPDHSLVAYSVDTSGSEKYALYVKDLTTGELLPDRLVDVTAGFEWAEDDQTLFYTRMDAAHRPDRLLRHRLGTDTKDDALVFHEPDESYYLYIGKTRSKKYLLLHLSSISSDEFHFLPADRPAGEFRMLQQRRKDLEYSVDHHGDYFYIVTNHQARNFRLVKAPVDNPDIEHWEEVIPHRPDTRLHDVDLFADHMVVSLREQGMTTIHIHDPASGSSHQVSFPEPVYTVWPGDNPEFDSRSVRIVYTSLTTPRSVYDYHVAEKRLELKKRQPVLGGYDPALYETSRVLALAPDGTRVPISLVHRKGLERNGSNPTYLAGYGSYGYPYDPTFSSNRLSLIDRGFVFAIAHVRGGGDLGRPWYEAGKLLAKKNTFSDFIACAERLIAEGYTSPERLAIAGGSAGGLLIGAVLNMRPDLFFAAVADVPFVDVINTMLDTSIPLTVTEFDEWGDPREKKYYDYMKSYSPYDNVTAQAYPHLLVLAGLNDPRVQYWEPAKWVARLRAKRTDNNLLLLKTNMDAGHAGASGRYDYLRELAFEYAFVLDRSGMAE